MQMRSPSSPPPPPPLQPQHKQKQSADRGHRRHHQARVRVGRSNEAAAAAAGQDVDLASINFNGLSAPDEEEEEEDTQHAVASSSGRRLGQIHLCSQNSAVKPKPLSTIGHHQPPNLNNKPISLLRNGRYCEQEQEPRAAAEGPGAGNLNKWAQTCDSSIEPGQLQKHQASHLRGMDGAANQQQQQHHYYYAPTPLDTHSHQQALYLNSQASSSNQPTTCDEASLSNTDESATRAHNLMAAYQNHQHQQISELSPPGSSSDYHYYQVVVPENNSGHHRVTSTTQPAEPTKIATSPCKSIQRIVSSLFTSHHHSDHLHHHQPDHRLPLPPIPTINQNLVSSEPLIRSSSWQNKTLIDLRLQQQQQQPMQPSLAPTVHYLESSLIQKTLPCNGAPHDGALNSRYTQFPPPTQAQAASIELSNIVQQQQQYAAAPNEHLYYGLGTLRHNQSGEMLLNRQAHLYKSGDLNHSFHTLTDKNNLHNNNRHHLPYPTIPSLPPSMQLNATASHQQLGRQPGGSSGSSDSPLSSSRSPPKYKTGSSSSSGGRRKPLFGWLDQSTKFFLVFLLMLASGFLLLAALLSPSSLPLPLTTTPTRNTLIPIGTPDKAIQQQSTYEHELMAGSQTHRTNQQQPPLPPAISANELPNDGSRLHQPPQMIEPADGKSTLPSGGAWPPTSLGATSSGNGGPNVMNSISVKKIAPEEQAPIDLAANGSPTKTTTNPPLVPSLESSQQRYWIPRNDGDDDSDSDNYKACRHISGSRVSECSSRGHCGEDGTCFCYPGFSGPNCAIANCPNDCSQNGKCKLRQDSSLNNLAAGIGIGAGTSGHHLGPHLQSLAFQTTKPSRSRNSICPKLGGGNTDDNLNQTTWALWSAASGQQHNPLPAYSSQSNLYDNRLEWRCVCNAGYMGPDCSRAREIQCDNKLDDDNDGLIDCEDDDCCSLPVCNDHHMCFKSPDPLTALETRRPASLVADWDQQQQHQSQPSFRQPPIIPFNYSRSHRFYTQMQFMIGTQSYAKEWAFDRSRVAVVRGRVIKWRPPRSRLSKLDLSDEDDDPLDNELLEGIVSVRVDVVENAQAEFGFTLTREDGYFDMLVNGNEWITLLFNKNNYASIKRKIFVEANSFVLLEDNLEMWLTTSAGPSADGGINKPSDSLMQTERNKLDTTFNLHPSVEIHKLAMALKRDDERKRNQLFDCLANGLHQSAQFRIPYEPLILEDPPPQSDTNDQQLKTFILASSGAFSGSLRTDLETASANMSGQDDENSGIGGDDDSRRQPAKPKLVYNSAFFPPAASVVKPTISIQLLGPNNHPPHSQDHDGLSGDAEDPSEGPTKSTLKLKAVLVQLDIEGQSRRERLAPLPRLIYQFAWNRRNVYQQKVYGFGQLNLRIGYEFEPKPIGSTGSNEKNRHNHQPPNPLAECLTIIDGPPHQIVHNSTSSASASVTAAAFDKIKLAGSILSTATATATNSQSNRVVWFERKIYMEAHHLNQHSDLGKWTLDKTNRLDQDRQLIYFGSGWSLPYKLAYPPTLSEPILLDSSDPPSPSANLLPPPPPPPLPAELSPPLDQASRLMTRGPNSTMFILIHPKHAPLTSSQLIQIDSTGRRRLLEVPLSILANKLGLPMGDQFSSIYSAIATPPSSSSSASASASLNEGGGTDNRQQQHDLIVNDIQILYNNYLSTLYLSSKMAGKMVQISYSSLLVLNKTLSSGAPTADADDSIDIEPLCGFGRQMLSPNSPAEAIRSARLARLSAPHSMTFDEARQVLYFIDGAGSFMALDLVSHRLALLAGLGPGGSQRKSATAHSGADDQWPPAPSQPVKCRRQMLRMPLARYKPHRAHSLTWSRADSSLYFVDQNLVFAVRQDFELELVASGLAPAIRTAAAAHLHSLAPTCFDSRHPLGYIRGLAFDESSDDLIIIYQHQQTDRKQQHQQQHDHDEDGETPKIPGHLYLAKLRLGLRTVGPPGSPTGHWAPPGPIDLHSARSAWNPMIRRLAEGQTLRPLNKTTTGDTINWNELANRPLAIDSSRHLASGGSRITTTTKEMMINRKWIPFIHLSGGFKRIDSIEINPLDGSIFVLDSGSNSIRLIEPYDLNGFNLVERSDVNINRLFASSGPDSSPPPPPPSSSSLANGVGPFDGEEASATAEEDGENRKLRVLIVQNPISDELMEFHSNSGLQLSSTTPANNNNWIKSEFYYRILTNNKMVELDEDDKCDFDVQKTVLDYRLATSGGGGLRYQQQILNQASGSYVRLNKILDSTGNDFELVRLYTGSRFVLQTILVNHEPICEVATDYSGALSTYQPSGKDYWFELAYDTGTYLLREMIVKFDQSAQRQLASGPNLSNGQYDNNNSGNNNSYDNGLLRPAAKDWRQLKRIVYDRVFYHYCDLFNVNA